MRLHVQFQAIVMWKLMTIVNVINYDSEECESEIVGLRLDIQA